MSTVQNEIIKSFSFEERELFEKTPPDKQGKVLERIMQGEHSAYVFGKKYFFKNYFKINSDCLIPRPDTERVLEKALSLLPKNESALVADLCTGSGCIGLSLLFERPNAIAHLCDISPGALNAASENASLLGVADRTKFILCDLMKDNPLGTTRFDVIISNPPYLTSDELEQYPDLLAEPRIAFDGGDDGLTFYRRFVSAFSGNLKDSGAFVFEIGYSQADAMKALAKEFGYCCEITRDYGGNDRVALLTKSDKN